MKHAASILDILTSNPDGLGSRDIGDRLGLSIWAIRGRLRELRKCCVIRATSRCGGARWVMVGVMA